MRDSIRSLIRAQDCPGSRISSAGVVVTLSESEPTFGSNADWIALSCATWLARSWAVGAWFWRRGEVSDGIAAKTGRAGSAR